MIKKILLRILNEYERPDKEGKVENYIEPMSQRKEG